MEDRASTFEDIVDAYLAYLQVSFIIYLHINSLNPFIELFLQFVRFVNSLGIAC